MGSVYVELSLNMAIVARSSLARALWKSSIPVLALRQMSESKLPILTECRLCLPSSLVASVIASFRQIMRDELVKLTVTYLGSEKFNKKLQQQDHLSPCSSMSAFHPECIVTRCDATGSVDAQKTLIWLRKGLPAETVGSTEYHGRRRS